MRRQLAAVLFPVLLIAGVVLLAILIHLRIEHERARCAPVLAAGVCNTDNEPPDSPPSVCGCAP